MKHPIHYTALGDSLTEGLGVAEEECFAARYRAFMEARLGRKVLLYKSGVSGETAEDIWKRLSTDEPLRQAIRSSDMISLTAGGNDLLNAARVFLTKRDPQVLKAALRQLSRYVGKIIETVKQLRQGEEMSRHEAPSLNIRILNLYNPFPMFEETVYWVGRFNKVYLAHETPFIRIVDIYDAFLYRIDDLIGEDMVHPNAQGHLVMAEAVDAFGYAGIDYEN